jgi:hypothetical protein
MEVMFPSVPFRAMEPHLASKTLERKWAVLPAMTIDHVCPMLVI